MVCGLVDKDFKVEIKELNNDDINKLCKSYEYFSVGMNDEHYIFFDKEIYIKENIERISSMMVELNFELIKNNSK